MATHYRAEKIERFIERLKIRQGLLLTTPETDITIARIKELGYVIEEMEEEFNLKEE